MRILLDENLDWRLEYLAFGVPGVSEAAGAFDALSLAHARAQFFDNKYLWD
jgi:hypothetical protein